MDIRQWSIVKHFWSYLFLALLCLFVVFPLSVAISQSFMTNQEVNRWPPNIIPPNPTLANFQQVLSQQDLRLDLWLRNSLFAATCYTLVVILVCSPAAFAFARLNFPGNRLLFAFLLATIMIPSQVTLIPNYLLMKDLKWLDTFY